MRLPSGVKTRQQSGGSNTNMDKYLYEGFYSYNPVEHQHDDDYIPVDPGDHMEVETPLEFPVEGTMEQPKGWLKGRNLTKGVTGLFPGHPYVKFIRKESLSNSLTHNRPSEAPSPPPTDETSIHVEVSFFFPLRIWLGVEQEGRSE
ncbi:hypothetical protein C0Q70_15985 [Pomacea canaliculata]|uniref:SH3 domain-containing protein n=1 Tax=Pomacea canaliculata TaxID=400727 RepID=A0A2T7NNI0_POMCA|nr:hypothetical protein C0Q70_15985 [Pomacea canaliculata]